MISVIIPAYNSSATLERTVESVLGQTINDIEIVVINDGSSDDTRMILERLIELHPEHIRGISTENHGVMSARMTGISMAKGDWIGFVDADDVIESDMYELLLSLALKNNADISHCGFQMISVKGERRFFYNTGRVEVHNHTKGIIELLEGTYIEPSLCNKLFRKSLFTGLSEKIQDYSIRYNEDLLMNYYLFSKAQVSVYIDECKYHYLIHPASATHRSINKNKIYDPIIVKEIILREAENDVKQIAQKVYLRTCINIYNGLINRKKNRSMEDEMAVRKRIIDSKKYIPLLQRKQIILAELILHCPFCYRYMYRFYAKHILKNKYL